MRMTPHRICALSGAILLMLTPGLAQAYGGPGVGLGAISVVLGIVGSVFLMTLSLVWYPVKRMIRAMRGRGAASAEHSDGKTRS
jgi:hypothetical protein